MSDIDTDIEEEQEEQARPELPVTVQLRTPITDFGKEVTAVTFSREPDGHDAVVIDGLGEKAATLKLIERMCGLSTKGALALKWHDIAAIERAMGPFVF